MSNDRSVGAVDAELKKLSSRRIFFGHQSVGMDILAGVQDLLSRRPDAGVRIAVAGQEGERMPGTVTHTSVGTNGDPMSKIRAFANHMDSGAAADADIALFKFCYIDVDGSTDVEQVFSEYERTMTALKERHRSTRFVHVTMPLRMVQTGPKALVKKVLARPIGGYAENILRHTYNEKLRRTYGGREPLFDLARIESTRTDGSLVAFDSGGSEFFALNPEYTYDNGHLNEEGRIRAAEEFVRVLASVE